MIDNKLSVWRGPADRGFRPARLSPDAQGLAVPSGKLAVSDDPPFVVAILDLFFIGSVVCWFGLLVPGDSKVASDRDLDPDWPRRSREHPS